MASIIKVYFDGSCRPMPHGMATAIVVRGVAHVEHGLGPGGSMEAEWLALLRAAEIARQQGLADPLILGDALAVIMQANGKVRCPAAFAAHFATYQAIRPARPVRYIKRTQNLAGIAFDRDQRVNRAGE